MASGSKKSRCTTCALPADRLAQIHAKRAAGWGPDRIVRWARDEMGWTDLPHSAALMNHLTKCPAGIEQKARHEAIGRVAELLADAGIDPLHVGAIEKIRLSEWQGITKNADGEAEVHDLKGTSVLVSPAWASGPEWQPVDRGAPVVIRPTPRPKASDRREETVAIIPDVQIGYWRDPETFSLVPFHDEAAMALALAVIREARPDRVVILGDFLDFAPLSRFTLEAGFALTMQPAIDRGVRFLREIQAAAPGAAIVFLEGNHDRRLQDAITKNALAAFGLKRGESAPEDWPVLSVPYLLRMDEMGVTYVGGYPAGEYWLNDNLVAIHGHKVRSNGSTAQAVIEDERVSILFGHTHRIELMHKTRRVRHGRRSAFAASVGCLCSVGGVVPSTKGAVDVFGRPVPTVEDWQHGLGIVTVEPGDGTFALEVVPIHTDEGVAWFRGRAIRAVER